MHSSKKYKGDIKMSGNEEKPGLSDEEFNCRAEQFGMLTHAEVEERNKETEKLKHEAEINFSPVTPIKVKPFKGDLGNRTYTSAPPAGFFCI